MVLHFPSLPCIPWLLSSLIVSSDDFPAHPGDAGQAAPCFTFLGRARWCRAASRAGTSGLGLRVLGHPSQAGLWGGVLGGERGSQAVRRHELGLP